MRVIASLALLVWPLLSWPLIACVDESRPPAAAGGAPGGGAVDGRADGGGGGGSPDPVRPPGAGEGEGEEDGEGAGQGHGGENGPAPGDQPGGDDEGGGPAPGPRQGAFGTDCDDNADCASRFCVQTALGRACTVPCTEECPRDWQCRTVATAGADAASLCFPRDPVLCEPCDNDDQCGGRADLCVAVGRGAYCGIACSDAQPCPAGFACREVAGPGGARLARQCLPEGGSCAPCADRDGDGFGQGGDCLGPDCDDGRPGVNPGAIERCNNRDDDCDLDVDEGIDTLTDTAHCGGCDRVCAPPSAEADCVDGACVIVRCAEGFFDADGDADNGCEYGCDPQGDEVCDAAVVRHLGGVVVLDGGDQDCDGAAENGFRPDGQGRSLGGPCGLGPCAGGFWECDGTGQGLRCSTDLGGSEAVAVAEEECNGVDDTCTGRLRGIELDRDGDGWLECQSGPAGVQSGDCDDQDAATFPGARERCDYTDNDCDGVADRDEFGFDDNPVHCGGCSADEAPEFNCRVYFEARDGQVRRPACAGGRCVIGACRQGFHDLNGRVEDGCEYACEPSDGAVEVCDGRDNDCDGRIDAADPAMAPIACELQLGVCAGATRPAELCVDGRWLACERRHYAAWAEGFEEGDETRCDRLDNDCDGQVNEGLSADGDADGHYALGSCDQPADDCDDRDPQRRPGLPEACDGKDNDCDVLVDEGLSADNDADGHYTPGSCFQPADDCDDGRQDRYPGLAEVCDGVDNDCDQAVDDGLSTDNDVDGHYTFGSCLQPADDCDDARRDRHPARGEACDGVDNDCDGVVDDGLSADVDADGHYAPGSCFQPADDCDDINGRRHPANVESCDGLDNDCNGSVDPAGSLGCVDYWQDQDDDSWGVGGASCLCAAFNPVDARRAGDCYDGNASARPGQGGWFTSHRGDGSFDYNCDGQAVQQWTATAGTCRFFGDFCDGGEGYSGGPPACGQARAWLSDCYYSTSGWPWEWGCRWRNSPNRTQACQ